MKVITEITSKERTMKRAGAMALATLSLWATVHSQDRGADVASKLGHPQMVLYHGKIVTMDDASFESRVGTIVEAMAIRNGKILATGTSAVIRALAGPETQSIDLKGRTGPTLCCVSTRRSPPSRST